MPTKDIGSGIQIVILAHSTLIVPYENYYI